jgi:PBP1b-binding outer membrane lipoprotein LpoB
MKKSIIALALAGTFVLTGCSVTSTPTKAPTTKSAPAPEPEPTASPEQLDDLYMNSLAGADLRFKDAPESIRVESIEVAHSACEAFDRGVEFTQLYDVLVNGEADFESDTATVIIGSAVAAYCPQHQDVLPG